MKRSKSYAEMILTAGIAIGVVITVPLMAGCFDPKVDSTEEVVEGNQSGDREEESGQPQSTENVKAQDQNQQKDKRDAGAQRVPFEPIAPSEADFVAKLRSFELSPFSSSAKTVLGLRSGSLRRLPPVADETLGGLLNRLKQVGDLAWAVDGKGYILFIASGRCASLPGKLVAYAGRDLASLAEDHQTLSNEEAPPGSCVLIEAVDGSFAVVNLAYVGLSRFSAPTVILVTWLHRPDGAATFSRDELISLKLRGEKLKRLANPSKPQPPLLGIAVIRSLTTKDATVMDFQQPTAIRTVKSVPKPPVDDPLEQLKQFNAYVEQLAGTADLVYDGTYQQLVFGSGVSRYLGEGRMSEFAKGDLSWHRVKKPARPRSVSSAVGYQCRPDAVLVFLARNENHVMLRVLERDENQIKLRWAYQPDGTGRFPDIPILPADKDAPKKSEAEINNELHKVAHTPVNAQNAQKFTTHVEELIAAGGDLNALNSRDHSAPLHAAVVYGSTKTVEVLVSLGADVNVRSGTGATPLHSAIAMGRVDICETLLKHRADATLNAPDGRTTLQYAVGARRPDSKIIEMIRRQVGGDLSLLEAAEAGDLSAVNSAITKTDKIDQMDQSGRTPLFLAAQNGHVEICRVLLDQGADPRLRGTTRHYRKPVTPLYIAIVNKKRDVAKLLLEQGEEYTPEELAEALAQAVIRNDAQSCATLLTMSVPKDAVSDAFRTSIELGWAETVDQFLKRGYELPLWAACRLNRLKDIYELVAKGADVNSPDDAGTPPIHYAIQNRNKEAVALLLENGADVNSVAEGLNNREPLHIAAAADSPEIVKLLIAKGADVNAMTTPVFHTPLYYAVMTNQVDTAKVLLENGANPKPVELLADPKDKKLVESFLHMARNRPEMLTLLKKYGAK